MIIKIKICYLIILSQKLFYVSPEFIMYYTDYFICSTSLFLCLKAVKWNTLNSYHDILVWFLVISHYIFFSSDWHTSEKYHTALRAILISILIHFIRQYWQQQKLINKYDIKRSRVQHVTICWRMKTTIYVWLLFMWVAA
jgi:uncharacterized membrane protein